MNKNQNKSRSSNKIINNKLFNYLLYFIIIIIIILLILLYYKYNKTTDNFSNSNTTNTNSNAGKEHKNIIIFNNTNIEKNINNIFLIWEGDINDNRLSILTTVIKSIYYFNNDKPIYLFSNSLKEEKIIDILNICKVVRYSYNDLILNTPIENKVNIKNAYEKIQHDGRMFSDFFRFIISARLR